VAIEHWLVNKHLPVKHKPRVAAVVVAVVVVAAAAAAVAVVVAVVLAVVCERQIFNS